MLTAITLVTVMTLGDCTDSGCPVLDGHGDVVAWLDLTADETQWCVHWGDFGDWYNSTCFDARDWSSTLAELSRIGVTQ